jgi:hypothetical protein
MVRPSESEPVSCHPAVNAIAVMMSDFVFRAFRA